MFLAYVLGAAGSGKTSLLRAFVGKGFDEEDKLAGADSSRVAARGPSGARAGGGHVTAITAKGMMTTGRGKDKSVVNCVEEGGGERYLVVSFSAISPSHARCDGFVSTTMPSTDYVEIRNSPL